MRTFFIALAALFLLTACGRDEPSPTPATQAAPAPGGSAGEAADRQTESERLNAWFEERYEEQLQQSPIQLTFIGRKERYD